ncbi:MAG TPA: phosphoribosylamine--glycine ligase, partial [Candidatus Paceibacterota bacterium]
EGMADSLLSKGIKVFGATKAASKIEWSKSFAKELMEEEGIPTAKFRKFSDISVAQKYIDGQKFPLVIKADGLALGKGVIIAKTKKEAETALKEIMSDKTFGDAGNTVVIEEYLVGEEISIHAFCDGKNFALFPTSQDHKRIYENEEGPNTGGMGTIAPVPWVKQDVIKEIQEKILIPIIRALDERECPFKGIIYPGIMITRDGPKVIEFNARFGDPETQSYMRLLQSDLLEIMVACAEGTLAHTDIKWSKDSACTVVLASRGYPGKYDKNIEIKGIEKFSKSEDIVIFHAGTKKDGDKILTSGGRVLGITAVTDSLDGALRKAYKAIKEIQFDGVQFRRDIGQKSLKK